MQKWKDDYKGINNKEKFVDPMTFFVKQKTRDDYKVKIIGKARNDYKRIAKRTWIDNR